MNKISVHFDLSNRREDIMFEYLQAFDEVIEYLNSLPHDAPELTEKIDHIVRSYNTHMPRG